MPYIALKRLTVGETDEVVGTETVGIKKTGVRKVGLDGGGNPIEEDVFEPVLAEVHAPLYREPGELVPEADEWPNVQVWVNAGHVRWVPDDDVKRASKETKAAAGRAK